MLKEFSIKNLTAEINDIKNNDSKGFQMIFKNGSMSDLDLADTTIKLSYGKNEIKVNSLLRTKGKFDYFRIKKISSLFNLDISNFNEINGVADLKTSINFNLDDKFRIKDSSYSIDGNIEHFEIHTKEKRIIKKYLPEYDPKIILKDANLKLVKSKSNYNVKLSGYLKVNKNLDTFNINKIYNFDKKSFHLVGTVDLTNSKFRISRLNYRKNEEKKASLGFDVNFVVDKYYNINKINFYEDKNKIELSKIKLNKNFEVVDLDKIKVETFLDKKKNNDFLIKKSKKITISGQLFDAQPLLKSLYKKSDKRTFSKKFSSEVKINFDKMVTGTNDDISNFAMIALINKGSYEKLSSKGNFSDKEIVEISIYKHDGDKKTLQVISDRARPFVKNFDFIKGFEGGKLEYESIISKESSNSNLLITDFKVSKVPALAQLLTLASLQGIADTLSGEGIRFESFEMKSNSKNNVLNIEDALAMGPAVSILLEGYVDKGKIVSLRGTLVPATKLNSIIASIPVVGDILVGKKSGEGVVGVSFKMKGPPKDIKTTVNPIKTLTPRFIVRAVEKMKKKKKEESK